MRYHLACTRKTDALILKQHIDADAEKALFAYRVWLISAHKIWLPLVILILAVTTLVFGIITTIRLMEIRSFMLFHEKIGYALVLQQILPAVADCLILGAHVWYLRSALIERSAKDDHTATGIFRKIVINSIQSQSRSN